MAGKGWKTAFHLVILLGICTTTNAGIILRDTRTHEQISVPYIVPVLELIGLQSGSMMNHPAEVMTVKRNEEWCDNMRNNLDDPLEEFRDSALIMPYYFGLGTGEECNGDSGTWISMEGIGKLCNKSSVVITVFRPGVFPGLFVRSHIGDRFSKLKAKYGQRLERCMILVFELPSDEGREFIFDGERSFEMNLTIDKSVAVEVFDSPFTQFALRGVLSVIAIFTIYRAIKIIRGRLKVKKLENVHAFLLFSNVLLMFMFGTFQAMGTDFISLNVPYHVHLGLFFLGNGTEVASLYVLALMYYNLLQKSKNISERSRKLSARRLSYIIIAFFLCLMDIMVLFANFNSSLGSTTFTFVVAPSVALSLQVFAVGFLFYQVNEMVHLLKQGNEYQPKGSTLPKTVVLHLQLSFWMKWTVFFSCLSTFGRLIFLLGFALSSPEIMMTIAFIYKLGVIGGSLSQVESAKLPGARRARLFGGIFVKSNVMKVSG